MLKASALYIVIIVAVVIAVFSGALLTTAYFYRLELQKNIRYSKLVDNLSSGTALMLSRDNSFREKEQAMDLYGESTDSVLLKEEGWGLFELATIQSFTLGDTIKKAFLIGESSSDPSAIYLSDEDRPISVGGDTRIIGDAELPKSGISQAYVEGKPYKGAHLVEGKIRDSQRTLPEIKKSKIADIESYFKASDLDLSSTLLPLNNSFFNPVRKFYFRDAQTVSNVQLTGKVIIQSDTMITIKKDAILKDIIVAAPVIVVEEGFKGSCQLFASDSVVTGKDCIFTYPSVMGVIRSEKSSVQPKVSLGKGSKFTGILFAYEETRNELRTSINLGKDCLVKGEIFAVGYVNMNSPVKVEGKVSCSRFVMQTPVTLYVNYLIDIIINRKVRNPAYLTSSLFNNQSADKQVLKWLN